MAGIHPILTCREVIDLLDDDLEGIMPLGRLMRFRLHMFLCRHCRRFRRTYRRTVGMVRLLRSVEATSDKSQLPRELYERILLSRDRRASGENKT